MTSEKRKEIKKLAVMWAHQMDDEKELYEGIVHPRKEEEIRELGSQLRNEIFRKGYDIYMIMYLAEEYKNLSMSEYFEWMDNEG